MLFRFCRVVVVSLALAAPAFGYGNAGHEAVGNIAAFYLKGTRAEQEVRRLLTAQEDLARAATWADRAKIPDKYLTQEMKDFVAANPGHHQYHYCDIPFQEKAYKLGITGTNPQDIVQTMAACIKVLQSPTDDSANPLKINKRIALMLLTHYAGDLHQPLHVGCSYVDEKNHFVDPETGAKGQADAGANDFRINTRVALHGYWDTATVKLARDHAGSLDFTGYLVGHYPPKPDWKGTGPVGTWPTEWATDTLQLAAGCYRGIAITGRHSVPGDEKHPEHYEWVVTLDPGYDIRARDVVEIELAKAGYRLAELLKAIWPGNAPAGSPTGETAPVAPAPSQVAPTPSTTVRPSSMPTVPPMAPLPPMGANK